MWQGRSLYFHVIFFSSFSLIPSVLKVVVTDDFFVEPHVAVGCSKPDNSWSKTSAGQYQRWSVAKFGQFSLGKQIVRDLPCGQCPLRRGIYGLKLLQFHPIFSLSYKPIMYFLSVRFIWVYWFCVYLCPGTRIVSIDILVSHTSIALCPILFHITESTHKELDSGRQIILTIPPFCNLSRSKSASSEKVSLF